MKRLNFKLITFVVISAIALTIGVSPLVKGDGALVYDRAPGRDTGLYKDAGLYPGNVRFVGSTATNAVDSTSGGYMPDVPYATLDYAIGQMTASNGDVIYVLPGHAETISAAAGLDLDVAGITIIGLGVGSLQPTISSGTTTTATVEIAEANITVKNIKFISAIADLAVGLDIKGKGDGALIEDCFFTDGSSVLEMVIALTIEAGAHDVTIKNNRFFTVVGGGCAEAIQIEGAVTNLRITGNQILGDFSGAAVDGATAAAVNIIVADNRINNADASAGLGINLHAATTGLVYSNYVLNAKNTVAGIIAAACMVTGNYGSNAAGAQGILVPGVDT